MIIGKSSKLAIVLLGFLSPVATASQDTLDAVMVNLARVESSKSSYVEKKFIAFLDSSISQTGMLIYHAPDQVIRELHSPARELYEAKGDTLIVERNQQRQVLSLQSVPLINTFIESFRATLSGDIAKLNLYYKSSFTGTVHDWTLSLIPISKKSARYIEQINIKGAGGKIRYIEIKEQGGDRSEMVLTEISQKLRDH